MSVKVNDNVLRAIVDALGAEQEGEKTFISTDEIRIKYGDNNELTLAFVKNGKRIAEIRNMLPPGSEFCLPGASYKISLVKN